MKFPRVFTLALFVTTWAFPTPTNNREDTSNDYLDWTGYPPEGLYNTSTFGARKPYSGSGVTYQGNIGSPYCSNIVEVDAANAREYKYVAQFKGLNADQWNVSIWNKFDSHGKMAGWFSQACMSFTLKAGFTRYVAFDEDSQGDWAASPDSPIPTDSNHAYASTWGEFDFGSATNWKWSGFDVSAIVAQHAKLDVQGMSICDISTHVCSSITANAKIVKNAYTKDNWGVDRIGGIKRPGPVRLNVTLGY